MYFVELGIHPELSKAEILSVYGERVQIKHDLGNILLFDVVGEVDLAKMQDRLAGIVKIGEIFEQIEDTGTNLVDDLATVMFGRLENAESEGKIKFGISIYGDKTGKLARIRQKIGLTLKTKLKNTGLSVRYVDSKETVLSSVIVKTNKLIESGAEFVYIVVDKEILVGKTVAVQDFKAWSNRDYGRPARDAKSGMLPPKLARMMINLSGSVPKESVLLDPFCGSGTVLMEASLMGYKGLIGSDISEKAITDSKKNLEWMKLEADLHVSPAADVDKFLKDDVGVIVTETLLGPPLKGNEPPDMIKENIRDLMKMYLPSFETLYSVLNRGGKAVIAFPAFRVHMKLVHVPVKEMLNEIGFRIIEDPILYEREGQKVAREIFVLEK